MIDGPYVDFTLNKVPDNQAVRFSDYITDGKLTLLVFWSPDCGHCKIELPELDKYYQQHQDALNLVGIVKVPNDGVRQRTSDFIRLHALKWPTVVDRSQKVFSDYRVRTTPTTVVVDGGGKVKTVLLGSGLNLDQELGPLLASLKKTARSGL
jgi:thiol-disulfide isomerase/thioredoxin